MIFCETEFVHLSYVNVNYNLQFRRFVRSVKIHIRDELVKSQVLIDSNDR